MKHLLISISAILLSAILIASCGDSSEDATDSFISSGSYDSGKSDGNFYSDKRLRKDLDSLIDEICKIGTSPLLNKLISREISLESENLSERPDYLMPLNKAAEATTLEKKYRAAVIFKADMEVASMYRKPLTDYKQTIARLLVDINNPGFNINLNESHRRSAKAIRNMINELYNEAYKQNSVNLFWEAAVACAIEELYLLSNNIDKIPLILNDNQVRNIFKRISLITNGINLSSKEHRELSKTKELLKTVSAMNSQNVSQLQKKLQENRETLQSVRDNLI